MEKKKNGKKNAKILIIIAVILIIIGILLAIFIKKGDKKEQIYYATFIVDGNRHHDNDIPIIDGYISRLPSSPAKEGYVFDHWEIDGKEYKGNEIITSDVTLVAVFREVKQEKVIVTFNKDNGEKSTTKEINKYDKVTPISNPKKVGYEFVGWYREGFDEMFSFDDQIDEDITLTAKWEILVYIVNFDSNGGSKISSKVVDYKTKAKVPTEPTREGYKFLGWYLDDKKYDFNTIVTKDMTLVAKWETISYTVKFDTNGGSSVDNQKVNYNTNAIKPTNPTKEGYKFIEWTLDGKTYDFNNKVNKDITLVAKWEKIEDKIAYGDANEDGIVNSKDALLILNYIEKNKNLTKQGQLNADVNADGKINKVDSTLVLRFASGWYYDVKTLPDLPIKDYVMYGDLTEDGIINENDSIKLQQYLNKEVSLNTQATKNADVNGDGSINSTDYDLLEKYISEHSDGAVPNAPLS